MLHSEELPKVLAIDVVKMILFIPDGRVDRRYAKRKALDR